MAGRLVVYQGEPESYVMFFSPEACITLDKYLDFRREHGEQISDSSPVFREKFDPVEALGDEEQSKTTTTTSSAAAATAPIATHRLGVK